LHTIVIEDRVRARRRTEVLERHGRAAPKDGGRPDRSGPFPDALFEEILFFCAMSRRGLVSTESNALVCIVDDDESVREALEGLMESVGFRVQAFQSAMDFLASADLGATACVIVDVHMPRISGIELHRRLAELGHDIPTILVTAYPNEAARDRALADGVVCYLTKPFDDHSLIGCVRSALQNGKPGTDA
jgi:CheY-like chemotaxis protein